MANGTIKKRNTLYWANISGTVTSGVMDVSDSDMPGTPVFAYDGGGWYWSISRHNGKWHFAAFSLSGTTVSRPSDGERSIVVLYTM